MNNNMMNVDPAINSLNYLLQFGQNPQQILQNVIAQNPQLQQVFSQIGSRGLTPKNCVMYICQQKGINLQNMINFMQSRGFKM